jgi:hypothetical protein
MSLTSESQKNRSKTEGIVVKQKLNLGTYWKNRLFNPRSETQEFVKFSKNHKTIVIIQTQLLCTPCEDKQLC